MINEEWKKTKMIPLLLPFMTCVLSSLVKVGTKPNTEKKAGGQGQHPGGGQEGKAPRSSIILAI